MYVCMNVCMHVCMYVCMHAYMHACVCVFVYTHTHTHTCMHTSTHTYINTYTYIHTHILEGRASPRWPHVSERQLAPVPQRAGLPAHTATSKALDAARARAQETNRERRPETAALRHYARRERCLPCGRMPEPQAGSTTT